MDHKDVFLVFTDVVGSTPLDATVGVDPIDWRKASFLAQLKKLLSIENALALKSIGDALFIVIENSPDIKSTLELCKEILACTYDAYLATKKVGLESSLGKEIKIRAVIHLITEHNSGEKIADEILKWCGEEEGNKCNFNNKSQLLIESLKKDIFGKEVNKAARIQSLVKSDAILISEEIAKIISSDIGVYENKLKKLAYIDFDYLNRNFRLHSPVPIIHLKGIESIKFNAPITIWQLDERNSAEVVSPTLATEFKSYQMLRLLMTNIDVGFFHENPRDYQENIHKEVMDLLTIKNLNNNSLSESFNFYNNFIWDVIDQFDISQIGFKRPIRNKNNALVNSNNIHGSFFDFTFKHGEYKLTPSNSNLKELIISQIIFSSFPSRDVAIEGRKMLECRNNGTKTKIAKYIEPQTIDTFVPCEICFDEIKDNTGYFILLFFGIHLEHISESNEENKIFEDINLVSGDNLKIHIRGLNTGLIDGFVLFKVMDSVRNSNDIQGIFESRLNYLLAKYKGSLQPNSFFSKTFPITFFLLKNFDDYYYTNATNIDYLNRVRRKYLDSLKS